MSKASDKHDALELQGEEQANVFVALGKSVQEKPLHYAGAALFIVAVVVFTALYTISNGLKAREVSSEYAQAILLEDPAERAAALDGLASGNGDLSPRALYLQGEAYLLAGDHDAAKAAFTKLRESYADFEFVPDAVEGLGFISEDQGNTGEAATIYREVYAKWPDSPAGRRQPFNIARCLEEEDAIEEAIEAYREQLEVFPGSTVAFEAQQRLVALRTSHPDLFDDPLETLNADAALDAAEAVDVLETE